MFRKKKAARPNKVNSLVGPQTEINGNVNFSGGLHVEGTVSGNVVADVDADAILILSETGLIKGEVRAPFLVINGTVEGDVHASERLELTAKARIKGNVYYNLIEMAIGAEVNGNLIHYAGGDKRSAPQNRPAVGQGKPAHAQAESAPAKPAAAVREVSPVQAERRAQADDKSGPFGFGH